MGGDWLKWREAVSRALGAVARWKILVHLARESGWHPVSHLAGVGGVTATACSKHMSVLRQCGLVERGRSRLYRLPAALRPLPGAEVLNLGVCTVLLRLPQDTGSA